MKSKLLVFLLAVVFSATAFSQFETLRPKVQEATAYAKAVELGIEDPILIGVGTTTGEVDEEFDFDLTYDAETGHAAAWFYYYKSASDANERIIISVVNVSGFYLADEIDEENLSAIPPIPDIEIDVDWMDSNEFGSYLFQNDKAKEFFTEIPNSEIDIEYVTLSNIDLLTFGNNEWQSGISESGVYWTIVADNKNEEEPPMICYTHAVTGETFCSIINSVNEIVADHGLYPFPNPASDRVTIPLPQDIMSIRSVKLIAADGIQTEFDVQGNFENDALNFQIDQFYSGRYILTVEDEQRIFVYPLVIIR